MKKQTLLSKSPKQLQLHVPDFKRVALTLVGCGGTGSQITSGLVAIQRELNDRDIHFDVLLMDPDVVEAKNIGRQLFAVGDIGKNKARVLAERCNAAFGTRFGALPRAFKVDDALVWPDADAFSIVIGAVDNVPARKLIARAVHEAEGALWWIDAGNDNHSGQIALGNTSNAKDLRGSVSLGMTSSLPAPPLVYPDLLKAARVKREKRARSCAELTATGEQSLMINRMVAAWACSMLHDFLVTRSLRYFAVAMDLRWGGARAYAIDVPALAEVTGLKNDQLVVKESGRR